MQQEWEEEITGASHVIAKAAKELNILTVGVTTLPFSYEGPKRMKEHLKVVFKKHLDTQIVVQIKIYLKLLVKQLHLKSLFIFQQCS